MRQPQHVAPKKPSYPAETPGSRLAAKARKLGNKLAQEQRREAAIAEHIDNRKKDPAFQDSLKDRLDRAKRLLRK